MTFFTRFVFVAVATLIFAPAALTMMNQAAQIVA